MTSAKDKALESLRYTGRGEFRGRSTGFSTRYRICGYVFLLLLGVLIVGLGIRPLMGGAQGRELAKAVGYLLALGLLGLFTAYEVAKSWRSGRMQRRKVLIDAHGLALAGFAPIPWEGLQPAERKKIEERDRQELVMRWVIPLTWKGRDYLRDHLSDTERALLVPRFPGKEPTRLFLPAVRGLSPKEFAEVYDTAFQRYWRG